MRHSSWTLLLVPLTLPLVFLCVPGTMKPTDRSNPAAEATYESPPPEASVSPEIPDPDIDSGEEHSGDGSEGLFR
jgi:hypothetical protein